MAEKEYIERETLINACKKIIHDRWNETTAPVSWSHAYADFIDDIKAQPTADVAPVRHVTNRAKYFGETLCPNCGIHLDETTIISKDENEDGDITHYEFQPNFCANCGARMDGDADVNGNDNKTPET